MDEALRALIDTGQAIDFEMIEAMVQEASAPAQPTDVYIDDIDLERYDAMLDGWAFAAREVTP